MLWNTFVILFGLLYANATENVEGTSKGSITESEQHTAVTKSDSFLYFSYGSNMLTQRIHIHNPTAVRIGAAALKDYRLDFGLSDERWQGAIATVAPQTNSTAYGVLWAINNSDLEDLYRQEDVPEIYTATHVPVTLLHNTTIVNALTFYLTRPEFENHAADRRPSKTLLKVMVKGAKEANLPIDYIEFMEKIEHNGVVKPQIEQTLELKDFVLNESDTQKRKEFKEPSPMNSTFTSYFEL